MRMVVIADDITGAAELAGIAAGQGWRVRLLCADDRPVCCDFIATNGTTGTADEVVVIATDTRSMTEAEAVAETTRIGAQLSTLNARRPALQLFKKTDSALRGHVVAELAALMAATGYKRALYVPANPSKGRIISGGTYYIDGRPIAETAFSYDPEFPARTSRMTERFPEAAARGILMPDATTLADLDALVAQAGTTPPPAGATMSQAGTTLLAGGADLFSALLRRAARRPVYCDFIATTPPAASAPARRLIVCGSTQSQPLPAATPVAPMPLSVYDGSDDLSSWLADAQGKYREAGTVALTIPHRHRTGRDVALRLRRLTATAVQALVEPCPPQELIVEGGATAFAILTRLGLTSLNVVGQLAPGVVSLQSADGLRIILKPGSYRWTVHSPQQEATLPSATTWATLRLVK